MHVLHCRSSVPFLARRACARAARSAVPRAIMLKDHSSVANGADVAVRHCAYGAIVDAFALLRCRRRPPNPVHADAPLCAELDVSFGNKVIEGYVQLQAELLQDGASELVLDTRDLTIHNATVAPPGAAAALETAQFRLGEPFKVGVGCGLARALSTAWLPAGLVRPSLMHTPSRP